ncbi:MAG: hypothetical protein ACI9MX_000781 [Candidatus Aldehydirespiratoraceae bacterium]|jgi:hypothetical protein
MTDPRAASFGPASRSVPFFVLGTCRCEDQARPSARRALQVPVDQSAQPTRTGWKRSRTARDVSEFNPNASVPSMSWATFPGKIATKNAAATSPTITRYFAVTSSAVPMRSSTIPEITTTRPASAGNQSGTCARNSLRDHDRWLNPAMASAAPSRSRNPV